MILDGSIYIGTEIETKRASQQLATLENKMNRTAERINALKAKLNELGRTTDSDRRVCGSAEAD